MPNLTFYISENQSEKFKDTSPLCDSCKALCCDILGAKPENVHIIFVDVKPGCGLPVYIELSYRLTELRTPDVMANFMYELDLATKRASGLTARIRCFATPMPQLYARN